MLFSWAQDDACRAPTTFEPVRASGRCRALCQRRLHIDALVGAMVDGEGGMGRRDEKRNKFSERDHISKGPNILMASKRTMTKQKHVQNKVDESWASL